jgi:hypothetical protein
MLANRVLAVGIDREDAVVERVGDGVVRGGRVIIAALRRPASE